jgi:hypothetical protein
MPAQLHSHHTLLDTLTLVRDREYRRAVDEFEAEHGRPYDGASDADWDRLDKSYTAVDEAIHLFCQAQAKAA